jgi:hypothetical protein
MLVSALALVSLAAVRPSASAVDSSTPVWLTRPPCASEAALARAAPFMVPTPRRVEETHLDDNGRSTAGSCLPFSILLQLQRTRAEVPASRTLADIFRFRDVVLEFATENHKEPWCEASGYPTLGHVIEAVAELRGWASAGLPRSLVTQLWAARIKALPADGCDAAFLFSAAACFGLRIHVHYKTEAGGMACTRFAVPASSASSVLRRPTIEAHVGYCDNEAGDNHYVAMPPLLWG